MATSKMMSHLDRFIDVGEESGKLLQPIEGYQSLPLVTLEEAVAPIVDACPDVRRRAWIAKDSCDSPKDGLTQDESAAIFLYTTEWQPQNQCVYGALNGVLRSKNRNRIIQPWLLYMKLLLMALFKLPSLTTTVWRGVRLDLRKTYEVGKTYTWWGLSSCTRTLSVLESDLFLGQEGQRTMFSIDCFDGKRIRAHSSFEDEDEILLLPGTHFIVKSHLQPSKKDPDLIIIQLEQVKPPFLLLELPEKNMALSTAMSNLHISASGSSFHEDSKSKTKSEPATASASASYKTDSSKPVSKHSIKEPLKEEKKPTMPSAQPSMLPLNLSKNKIPELESIIFT